MNKDSIQKKSTEQPELFESIEFLKSNNIKVFPVSCKTKVPLVKWRDSKVFNFDEIIDKHGFINLGVAGGIQSDNLVILDFDNLSIFEHVYDTNDSFREVAQNTLKVKTARGVHVYIRAPFPVKGRKNKKYDIDIKGEGGYCLGVPSIHPDGPDYKYFDDVRYIYPLFRPDELDIIELERYGKGNIVPFKSSAEATGSPRIDYKEDNEAIPSNWIWEALTPFYRDILRNIIPIKYYKTDKDGNKTEPDRSRADQALLVLMIKDGFEFKDILNLYEARAVKSSKFMEKEEDRKRYLYHSFLLAEEYFLSSRSLFDLFLDYLYREIKEYEFFYGNARTDKTDSLVMLSMIYVMRRTKKFHINLAIRDIRLLTGLGLSTITNSLKRLVDNQYLNKTVTELKFGNLYCFGIKVFIYFSTIEHDLLGEIRRSYTDVENEMKPFNDLLQAIDNDYEFKALNIKRIKLREIISYSKDSFSYTALNKDTDLVEFINNNLNQPVTLQYMCSTLKKDRKTIKRKIDKLKEVVKIKDIEVSNGKGQNKKGFLFYEKITDKKLKELSILQGVDGTEEKREKKITQEREQQEKYIEYKESGEQLSLFG